MAEIAPLNLFYSEPDPDRWFKYDRYPRRVIRKLFRGKQRTGGVAMVAVNLTKGLDKLNIPYRYNDYKYARTHPEELACIIGKPHVLFERKWGNPILLGPGIYSHPVDYPNLLQDYPNVQKLLVPGEWMQKMFEPYYGSKVLAWPVGIDTDLWKPSTIDKQCDFLIYDKIMWNYKEQSSRLLEPIISILKQKKFTFKYIRYGKYMPHELLQATQTCKAAIFLCEHETQGLAYQQILSTNTPILAWDIDSYWLDPNYYPHKVKYGPVTSTPYWDNRCGEKFNSRSDFEPALSAFLQGLAQQSYHPRAYILENLTLEKCAIDYVEICHSLTN